MKLKKLLAGLIAVAMVATFVPLSMFMINAAGADTDKAHAYFKANTQNYNVHPDETIPDSLIAVDLTKCGTFSLEASSGGYGGTFDPAAGGDAPEFLIRVFDPESTAVASGAVLTATTIEIEDGATLSLNQELEFEAWLWNEALNPHGNNAAGGFKYDLTDANLEALGEVAANKKVTVNISVVVCDGPCDCGDGGDSPTTFTWAQILATFFETGGGHGTLSVAAVEDGITVGGRTASHQGLGVDIAALRAIGAGGAIVITGEITGGGGGWGPRFDLWADGSHTTATEGNATSITIAPGASFAAGTAHRLIANGDSIATAFKITGITVGGTSIVEVPAASTTFTWAQILSTFFETGGAHGSTVTSAVADGITVERGDVNHEGLGINIAALRALAPGTDIVITGAVAVAGEWARFEVWRGGASGDSVHQNSETSLTIAEDQAFASGTAHRLLFNTTPAGGNFKITDITVDGNSIVEAPASNKFTWTQILSTFFTTGGAHGTGAIAAVSDGITVGRDANHVGLGVNVAALREIGAGDIVITGELTESANWSRFELWREGANGNSINGSATSVTIASAESLIAGTSHRLVVNSTDPQGANFKITDITVGGESIVDSAAHVCNFNGQHDHLCGSCGEPNTAGSGLGHNGTGANGACSICGLAAIFRPSPLPTGTSLVTHNNGLVLSGRGVQVSGAAFFAENTASFRVTTSVSMTGEELFLYTNGSNLASTANASDYNLFTNDIALAQVDTSNVWTADWPFPTWDGANSWGLQLGVWYEGDTSFTFTLEALAECGCVVFGSAGNVTTWQALCPHQDTCTHCSELPCIGARIAPIFGAQGTDNLPGTFACAAATSGQGWSLSAFKAADDGATLPAMHTAAIGAALPNKFVNSMVMVGGGGADNHRWGARIPIGGTRYTTGLGLEEGKKYTISVTYFLPSTSGTAGGIQFERFTANAETGITHIGAWSGWRNSATDGWFTIISSEFAITGGDGTHEVLIQPSGGISGPWYISSIVVNDLGYLCSSHTWGDDFICTSDGCTERKPRCATPAATGGDLGPCTYNAEGHLCTKCGYANAVTQCQWMFNHTCDICGITHASGTTHDNDPCTICGFTDTGDIHPCQDPATGAWTHTFVQNTTGNADTHRCEHGCIVFAVAGDNDGTWEMCSFASLTASCPVCSGAHPCASGHAYQDNRPNHPNHGCSRQCGFLANGNWENCAPSAGSGSACVCGFSSDNPCPGCGGFGNWTWGGNDSNHWAGGCACTWNAPHTPDANGVCTICGREGVSMGGDGGGGDPGAPASACPGCGTVNHWRWGGNAESHWAGNCDCEWSEPHDFVNGVCRCGATQAADGTVTAPPEIDDDDELGDDETTPGEGGAEGGDTEGEGADGTTPPVTRPGGGATGPDVLPGDENVPPRPEVVYDDADFVDEEAFMEMLTQQLLASDEAPIIFVAELAELGGTVLSAEILQAIAQTGRDVTVVLENGFTFAIVASSISADAQAFDLNIEVEVNLTGRATTIETVGGDVRVPANAIVFTPNFSGDFGFDIVFTVTAAQLAEAGLNGNNVRLWYVDYLGFVTDMGRVRLNADGSVEFTISNASFYVLSEDAPEGTVRDENPSTGVTVGAAALAVSAAAAIMLKKRNKRK
jgi:hypothetical protein